MITVTAKIYEEPKCEACGKNNKYLIVLGIDNIKLPVKYTIQLCHDCRRILYSKLGDPSLHENP